MPHANRSRFCLLLPVAFVAAGLVGCADDKEPVEGPSSETESEGLDQTNDPNGGGETEDSELSCDEPAAVAGDVTLTGADIGTFCDENNAVDGNLTISGGGFADLGDLSCLCSVGGVLTVDGTDATSLDGLDDVASVGGLSLLDNASLTDIQALGQLTAVPGDVIVRGSPELANLVGLDSVVETGAFTIEGLGITTLRGLGGLVTVGGDFTLRDLPVLADMTGAGALDFVDGSMTVENTPGHDFTGLDSIRRIRQALVVRNSEAELVGLDNLATIGGTLFLDGASRVASLDGLSGLAEVGGHLRIVDAPALNSLNGASNLRNITGSLWLVQTNVSSISGLTGLIAVGGLHLDTNPYLTSTAGLPPVIGLSELVLHWNADLEDLTHLDTVRTVDGPLTISGHVALPSVDALYGIDSVGGDVTIVNNVSLPSEDAQGLVDAIGREDIGGNVEVGGNSG